MYSVEHLRKMKNEKVMHCRLLLSEFDFDIVYHPGKLNTAPDALSRVYCAGFHRNTLYRADYTTPQIRWWRPIIWLCPDNQFACRTEIHRGVHVALWLNVWPRWLLRHAFRVKYCPVTKHGSLVSLCIFRKKWNFSVVSQTKTLVYESYANEQREEYMECRSWELFDVGTMHLQSYVRAASDPRRSS